MTRRTNWFRSARLRRKQLSARRGERSLAGHSRLRNRRLLLEKLEDRSLLAGEVFPNDPLFSTQWALHNTGQAGGIFDADMDAPEAWSVTTGSLATVVAVLDTGVDYTDSDLYLNIWLNEGEIPANIAANLTDANGDSLITFHDLNDPSNANFVIDVNANGYIDGGDLLADPNWENGVDEDGNGRTDDVVGWDFHNNDNDVQPEVVGGIYQSHGTDQAKQVGAMTNNSLGTAGINWNVRLIPVRIVGAGGLQTDIVNANAAAGIDYAVASGAPISNNSWRAADGGYVYSQEIYDAIDRARQAGHLFVGAAGNEGTDNDTTPFYPTSYGFDNIISATRVDASNQLTANYGLTSVDLGVSHPGGTSGASSYTSGVAALLKSAHPDWTYAQIKDRILSTVDPLPSLADKTVTGGRLNAAHAVGVVYLPNDPEFSQQWPLHNLGQTGGTIDADIDAPEAWSVTTGSMATVVAVLDSGVDYTHPDLYLNIWLNEGEIPAGIAGSLTDSDSDGVITFRDLNSPANTNYVTDINANGYIDGGDLLADPAWENGLDEDGNGRADDLLGWDFYDNDNDAGLHLTFDHGTSVAQRIASVGDNGIGRTGVLWSARLMSVRISTNNADRVSGAAALDYAVAEGATISNNSWGDFTYDQNMFDAIDRARLAGHLFMASAGNDSRDLDFEPRYPAAYNLNNILAVHAVDSNDQLTPAGSWGQFSVDLGAPTDTGANSQATPNVTGVAGLLRTLHPEWSYTQIKDRILATVDLVPSLAGKSVTGGRLNAANALGVAQFSISDATLEEEVNLTVFAASNPAILTNSADIAFGPSRNADSIDDLYVIGRFSDNVVVYDGVTGSFIEEFVAPSSGLDGPAWILIGPDGDLFTSTVSGSGKRDTILRVDQATKTVTTFLVDGTLAGAKGMAFGHNGNFYIADAGNDRVIAYDGNAGTLIGNFIDPGIGGLDSPGALLFGADRNADGVRDLYVASGNTDQVLVFDGTNGDPLGIFVDGGSIGLNGPHDMEFGPDGNLYVVRSGDSIESGNEQVYRFDGGTGAFIDIVIPPAGISPETSFITFDRQGNLYISSENTHEVLRYAAGPLVSLSAPSEKTVTIDFSTASGTATPGADYGAVNGRLTFAPGETSKRILVSAVDDTDYEGNENFVVNLTNPVGGVIVDGQGEATIVENDPLPTKFYVVDDGAANQTFEYAADGTVVENYTVSSGNTAPRGAASNVAGDKVWVVDTNRNVYVYDAGGALLGSWTAGSLATSADEQGIATDGTDVWIVDAKSDKVFRYTGAASRISGSQNAASSFSLNSGNKNPTDIVTDGTYLWVVNAAATDKVFKYTLAGSLAGSWTISTAGVTSPTGITLDPGNPNDLWIVDSGTDRVYQYDTAVGRTSGSQAASTSFALAKGNTNPQGIADPPVGNSTPAAVEASTSEEVAAAPALAGFPVVPPTGQVSTQTGDQDDQDVLALFWSEVGNPAAGLSAESGVKTTSRVAGTSLSLSSSHDDALCGIADELEDLVPVRRTRLRQ